MTGVAITEALPAEQMLLARRRARWRVFAYRLKRGDVIHAPSGPLRLLMDPERGAPVGGVDQAVLTVLDYFPTGEEWPHTVVLPLQREVLASRG